MTLSDHQPGFQAQAHPLGGWGVRTPADFGEGGSRGSACVWSAYTYSPNYYWHGLIRCCLFQTNSCHTRWHWQSLNGCSNW